jgi:uncharacterized membrane protein
MKEGKYMNVILRIIGLGMLNGSRTFTVPALLSCRLAGSDEGLMGRVGVSRALQVLALLELIGDKVPGIPNRIEPPGMIGRGLMGAWVGAVLSRRHKRPPVIGALIGAVSALIGAYIGFYTRRALTVSEDGEDEKLPDFPVALAEDAIVIGGGSALLRAALRD